MEKTLKSKITTEKLSMDKKWVLLLILFLAFALRIWGLDYGLPEILHADEPIVVNKALSYGMGDLNPHWFLLPPLTSYVLFFIYGIYFFVGKLIGIVHSVEEFRMLFLTDPTSFYLIGRFFLGVVPSVLSVWILYKISKEASGSNNVGLGASFFLAVNFLFVRDSHYIYADIPRIFMMLASLYYIIKILKDSRLKNYVFAGMFLGIAIAFKYNSVLLAVPFAVSHFVSSERKGIVSPDDKKLLYSFLVVCGVYILLNPFSIIDFKTFIGGFLHQSSTMGSQGWLHHLFYSLLNGFSIPLLTCSFLGIIVALTERKKFFLVLFSYIIAEYMILVFFSQPHARYVLPLIPVLCYFAAYFLHKVSRAVPHVTTRKFWYAVICFIISISTFAKTCYSNYIFTMGDTRLDAQAWIDVNISKGAKIALGHTFLCPRLMPDLDQLEEKIKIVEEENLADSKKIRIETIINILTGTGGGYKLFFLKDEPSEEGEFLFARPQIPFNYRVLIDKEIEYVVVTKVGLERHDEFFEQLESNSELIAEFNPYKDKTRKYSLNSQVLTGGPFLDNEVFLRDKTGYTIQVFKLEKKKIKRRRWKR